MNDDEKKTRPVIAAAETYRRTEVMTSNRETILLMMYSGTLRFIKGAIRSTEEGDLQEKARFIGKTQEIVNELRATLDFSVGGDIAKQLDMLYGFITDRLTESMVRKDTKYLKEALSVLTTLNEAWEQAVAQIRKNEENDLIK